MDPSKKIVHLKKWLILIIIKFVWQVVSSSASGNVNQNNFPVNSALMIGDYVTPGSIILPTQGIQISSAVCGNMGAQQQHLHSHRVPHQQ